MKFMVRSNFGVEGLHEGSYYWRLIEKLRRNLKVGDAFEISAYGPDHDSQLMYQYIRTSERRGTLIESMGIKTALFGTHTRKLSEIRGVPYWSKSYE